MFQKQQHLAFLLLFAEKLCNWHERKRVSIALFLPLEIMSVKRLCYCSPEQLATYACRWSRAHDEVPGCGPHAYVRAY